MMLQAWTIGIQPPAASQRKQLLKQLQAIMKCTHISIWSKVLTAIPHHTPGNIYTWKVLSHCYLHIWISLIILKADIILRPVLFYKVAFQYKSLHLRAAYNSLKILHMRYHSLHFRRMIMTLPEILRHAVFQTYSLAHIYYLALIIFHYINARTMDKLFQLFFYKTVHSATCFFSVIPDARTGLRNFPV